MHLKRLYIFFCHLLYVPFSIDNAAFDIEQVLIVIL